MDQIKYRRTIYDLVDGDTIMDNHHCRQLITRKTGHGWNQFNPQISKAEFKRFKEMDAVKKIEKHSWGGCVELWRYCK